MNTFDDGYGSMTLLQDIREGKGDSPTDGSTCSIDWDGYTIGYYVRPLSCRKLSKCLIPLKIMHIYSCGLS